MEKYVTPRRPTGLNNVEQQVNELSAATIELTKVKRRMFEQGHLRFVTMFTAAGSGGSNGIQSRYKRATMEHKVIPKLKAASGDKSMFRQ